MADYRPLGIARIYSIVEGQRLCHC